MSSSKAPGLTYLECFAEQLPSYSKEGTAYSKVDSSGKTTAEAVPPGVLIYTSVEQFSTKAKPTLLAHDKDIVERNLHKSPIPGYTKYLTLKTEADVIYGNTWTHSLEHSQTPPRTKSNLGSTSS